MGHRTQSIKTLVIAEHENGDILPGTLSTVTAALKLGGAVDLLVSGHDVKSSAAVSGSKIGGISKVLVLENESLGHKVAENLSKAVFTSNILKDYTHVLASSSVHGKNFFPRLAALCDAAPLSDIIEVVSEDTVRVIASDCQVVRSFQQSCGSLYR
jgi:electron transfer flavoprotein alpha subunit